MFATIALLLPLHFMEHGRDLNPVDHWLSEYVLSRSAFSQALMHLAFMTLGLAALSVAMSVLHTRPAKGPNWIQRADTFAKSLFFISAVGLAGMTFFDTDANVEPIVKSMHGNVHQILLDVAIGATLLGIVWVLSTRTQPRTRVRYESGFVGAAISATLVQACLVLPAELGHRASQFGGITERIIVIATLGWVWSFHSRP